MRTLLLISVLASVTLRGTEATVPTVRQKLHAKILESVPPSPSPKPPSETKEIEAPAVVMKPVVVSESKLIREVAAAIDREEKDRREERFTPLNGGKIYSIGRVQIGGWFSPTEGWTFLRLNKAPTRRQVEAAEARLKELQELLKIGENSKP
jgi:hypothetical protein